MISVKIILRLFFILSISLNSKIYSTDKECEELKLNKTYSNCIIYFKNYSDLDISRSKFIKVFFSNSKFINVNFKNSEFDDVNFSNSDFKDVKFEESKFKNATIADSNFLNVNFENSDFNQSHILTSIFRKSFLEKINFGNTNFMNSSFIDSSFEYSNLYVVRFYTCKQSNSSFKKVNSHYLQFKSSPTIEVGLFSIKDKIISDNSSQLQLQYDRSELGNIIKMAITNSSKLIAIALSSGILQIYRADTLAILRQFKFINDSYDCLLEFSEDEKYIFLRVGEKIYVWENTTGNLLYSNQSSFTYISIDKKNNIINHLNHQYDFEINLNTKEISTKKVIDENLSETDKSGLMYELYTSRYEDAISIEKTPSNQDLPEIIIQNKGTNDQLYLFKYFNGFYKKVSNSTNNIILSTNLASSYPINIDQNKIKNLSIVNKPNFEKDFGYYIYNPKENIIRINSLNSSILNSTSFVFKNENIKKINTPNLSEKENEKWEIHKNSNYIKYGEFQWNLIRGSKGYSNWTNNNLNTFIQQKPEFGRINFIDESNSKIGYIKVDKLQSEREGNISKFRKRQVLYSNSITEKKTINIYESYVKIGKEILYTGSEKIIYVHVGDEGNTISVFLSNGRLQQYDFTTGKMLSQTTKYPFIINEIFSVLDDKFLFLASDGGIGGFYNIEKNLFYAYIFQQSTGEWAVVSPDGRYEHSPYFVGLHWVNGLEIIPIYQFRDSLYTPYLLDSLLKNGPISSDLESRLKLNPPKITLNQSIIEKDNITTKCSIEINVTRGFSPLSESNLDNQKCIDNGKFILNFDIEVSNDKLREVSIFNNGKKLDIKINQKVNNNKINCSTEIQLEYGENIIVIETSTIARNISRSKEIEVYYKSNSLKTKPNLYILSIGINEYANPLLNLNFGKVDAESFHKSIIDDNSNYEKVISKLLLDRDATKEKIMEVLFDFQKNIKENDHLILYYAGHGKTLTNNDKQTFYFLPSGVNSLEDINIITNKGISSDDVVRFLRATKTSKQLLVIDACESGSISKAFSKFNSETGGHILFASGSKQQAKEFSSLGHGIFTYSLLESLKKYKSINISMLSGEMDLILEKLREKLNLYDQSFGYFRTQESPNFFIKDVK